MSGITQFEVFGEPHRVLYWNQVPTLTWKERGGEFGAADNQGDWNDTPAVAENFCRLLDVGANSLGYRDEEKWCGPPPLDDLADEFESEQVTNDSLRPVC